MDNVWKKIFERKYLNENIEKKMISRKYVFHLCICEIKDIKDTIPYDNLFGEYKAIDNIWIISIRQCSMIIFETTLPIILE